MTAINVAERRYNAGRWQQPRGTRYQTYGYGQRLPSSYNAYVVNDYNRYGLRASRRAATSTSATAMTWS
jgi:Ni/Co efflux regulator RcnB